MPFSYGYNPNSNSTWVANQEDMVLPGWSLDSVGTPVSRFEGDGISAWTQINDSLYKTDSGPSVQDILEPTIAGTQDDNFLISSHWKTPSAMLHMPPERTWSYLDASLEAAQPGFPRYSYSDSAHDSDWTGANIDMWHAGDTSYLDPLQIADTSPVNMSPLSRQDSNDFSSLESPSCGNTLNEESAQYYESPLSGARSSLQNHLDSIDHDNTKVATPVSTHQLLLRRRRSVRKSRRASGPNMSSSSSRRSSATDKKLICPVCNKIFQRDLARHLRTHEPVARFICPFPRDQCSHKRGQFNRGYDFKKHLLHYHFTFSDSGAARKLRDLNGKLGVQGHCSCGDEHEFDAEEWLEDHITCDPPKCPLLKGRSREVILQEVM